MQIATDSNIKHLKPKMSLLVVWAQVQHAAI